MTGCGSSFETGSKSDATMSAPAAESAAEAAGDYAPAGGAVSEAAEDYAPAESNDSWTDSDTDAAAADAGGYAYEDAEADMDYRDRADGSKVMESQSANSYADSVYDYDAEPDYSNTEEYSQWEEQGFQSVMNAPLSTFAADVDTASYSNLRRLINSGYELDELPQGAARIEEMINYFSYDYNTPKGMEPFGVTTQISTCPWNDDAKLLMIGLKTEDID